MERDGDLANPVRREAEAHSTSATTFSASFLDWRNRQKPVLSVWCWASNEQHAVKIANEQRTAAILTNAWEEK